MICGGAGSGNSGDALGQPMEVLYPGVTAMSIPIGNKLWQNKTALRAVMGLPGAR